MEFWQIATWVAAGLIGLFGFSFGVFWKILTDMKQSINNELHNVHNRIDKAIEERMRQIEENSKNILDLRVDLQGKVSSNYIDIHYQRKDLALLQIATITKYFNDLEAKVDKLLSLVKNVR